jgi:DNA modification methylase
MNFEMNIKKIPVAKMQPATYNPRKDLKPGDVAYEKIKRSLNDFGYVDPVIWNEATGNIVGGHQRYKVLVSEGATEIDCVVVHIENPNDEKALNIALNKAVGEWEPKALADLLTDLQQNGYDLGATAFDAAEIDDLFSQVHDKESKEDNFDTDAALKEEPFVKPGDLWLLGRHRMLCGDATNSTDIDTLMGGVKANLILTDPPYNVSYESAGGMKIQNDNMGDSQFFQFLLSTFKNMASHCVEGASVYVFHADTEGLNFRKAFKEAGFHISGVCIWVKNSLVLGRSPYQWQHEPILFGWLPNGSHKWFSDRKQSTIWNFDKPQKSADHPTTKPIPLLAYPIKNSSAPNGIVLDLFGGSGSTLIACEQADRLCFTSEIDPIYASVIVKRYVNLKGSSGDVSVTRSGEILQYCDIVKEVQSNKSE